MTKKRDYYEIIGLDRNASTDEVKRSYRKLAMKYHPDRNPGDQEAEERFKEAAEAYAVLSDAEKRAQYDQFGHSLGGRGFQGFEGFEEAFSGFGDVFGDLDRDYQPVTNSYRIQIEEDIDLATAAMHLRSGMIEVLYCHIEIMYLRRIDIFLSFQ